MSGKSQGILRWIISDNPVTAVKGDVYIVSDLVDDFS